MEEKYKVNNIVADLDNVLQRNLFLSNGLRQDQLNAWKTKPSKQGKYVVKIKLKTFQYISCDTCHSVTVN